MRGPRGGLVRKPGSPGDETEIVATTYHNLALPLIRYRSGDLAVTHSAGPCAWGLPSATVAAIQGRIEDVVVTPAGRHMGCLDAAFKYSAGIRLSRIVQKTTDEIRVDIVKAATYSDQDRETLERALWARLGNAIAVWFNFVDDILPGENGKIQFVILDPGRAAVEEAPL